MQYIIRSQITGYQLLVSRYNEPMTGTTHQMIALVAAFWVLTAFPVTLGPVLGILAIFSIMSGALTPDLDHPATNMWRRMLGGNHIGNIFRAFAGGHRHMTHSILGIFLIGWALRWIVFNIINTNFTTQALVIWYAFMIGYISHPIADSFTDQGVPWFWPFHFHIKIPPGPGEVRVTTDSYVERIIVRTAIIVIGVLLLQSNWQLLINFFK